MHLCACALICNCYKGSQLRCRPQSVLMLMDPLVRMSELAALESDSVADLRMSPETGEQERGLAPPPRRKSFSKLRRRLSQTFRFSFNGSLTEFPHSFVIREERDHRPNGEETGSWRTLQLNC